jgi:hypothetical protein
MLDLCLNPPTNPPVSTKVLSNIEFGYNEIFGAQYDHRIHSFQVYYADKLNPIKSQEVPTALPDP